MLIEKPVHLFLFVKVREGWADDPERYREMGRNSRGIDAVISGTRAPLASLESIAADGNKRGKTGVMDSGFALRGAPE